MRPCQRLLELRGGTCKLCKLQSFLISGAIFQALVLTGTSSEGDDTTRGDFGDISMGLLSFSLALSLSLSLSLSLRVGFSSPRLIRSTCQVGHFSFVRYFEILKTSYFWKGFSHKAAGRYIHKLVIIGMSSLENFRMITLVLRITMC